MFTVSPSGTLVDYMGFPLNRSKLQEILNAAHLSLSQSESDRIEDAQAHCLDTYPEMFNQLNWETFK